jgi:hypothetical protein
MPFNSSSALCHHNKKYHPKENGLAVAPANKAGGSVGLAIASPLALQKRIAKLEMQLKEEQ